jgi:hypothetical protein
MLLAPSQVAPGSITLAPGAVLILDGPGITIEGPLEVRAALCESVVWGSAAWWPNVSVDDGR